MSQQLKMCRSNDDNFNWLEKAYEECQVENIMQNEKSTKKSKNKTFLTDWYLLVNNSNGFSL